MNGIAPHEIKPMIFGLAWLALVTAMNGTAVAQPPVGPDPDPRIISPEELTKVLGDPTLVTLQFKDARPEQVFQALTEQAGVHLNAYETTDLLKTLPPLTVSIERQPFAAALHTLASKCGLYFNTTNSGGFEKSATGLTLTLKQSLDPQEQMSGPLLVRGPFVVIATSIQSRRTVALVSDQSGDRPPPASRNDLFVDFVVLGDPKLRAQGLDGTPMFQASQAALWDIRSADSEGPWRTRANDQGATPLEWRFTAHLKAPAEAGQRSVGLQATSTELFVTTKSETWEVPNILGVKDLAKSIKLTEGERRYTIHSVQPEENNDLSGRGERYAVRLTLSGVGISKGRWSGWPAPSPSSLIGAMRLVDAEGRDFAPHTYDLKGTEFSCSFWNGRPRGLGKPAVGKPAKLLWRLPTEIRTVEIPIEFAELPLP